MRPVDACMTSARPINTIASGDNGGVLVTSPATVERYTAPSDNNEVSISFTSPNGTTSHSSSSIASWVINPIISATSTSVALASTAVGKFVGASVGPAFIALPFNKVTPVLFIARFHNSLPT